MNPATKVRGARGFTANEIARALRRYADLYGEDFPQAAFSPSLAKWADRPELAERYMLGDPETGDRWPSLNSIRRVFGSFSVAREAAGLPVNKSGPRKGAVRRPAGEAAPIRDVKHVTRTIFREKDAEATRLRVERAEAKAVRLTEKVARLEAKLAARPKATTKTKTKTVTKTVTDKAAERRVARLEAQLTDAQNELKTVKVDLAEARQAATRAASKLERAEATISELRADRRDVKAALGKAEDRVAALTGELETLRARKPERVVVTEASPEAEAVRAAEAAAAEAEREARAARERMARAEREYATLAAAVKGEPRKLTDVEVAELRMRGPAGPVLVKDAIAQYIKAGRNKTALRAALTALARAAITYRERL